MKKIVDDNGNTVQTIEPVVLKQTVSRQTSDTVKQYLYSTVSEGTGRSAKVEGYSMGGKTGTAQKGNRDDKKYVVSFIGFAPVENPEVLVYVVIDEANVPLDQQSSALATELAKEIFTEILPYLNVFQDEEIEEGENPDNQEGNPVPGEGETSQGENPGGDGQEGANNAPPQGEGDTPQEGSNPEEGPQEGNPEEGQPQEGGGAPADPGGPEYPAEGVPDVMPEGAEEPQGE